MSRKHEQPNDPNPTPLWPAIAGSLFLFAVIGSVLAFNLIKKYRIEAAVLKGQLHETRNYKSQNQEPIQGSDYSIGDYPCVTG